MSLKKIATKCKLPLLNDKLLNYFIEITNTSNNNERLLVFGKDVLRDLSKNSIPIYNLGITQSTQNPINSEIKDITKEIKSNSYYSINPNQLKKLLDKTHKPNEKEIIGEVNKPIIKRLEEHHINSFSPFNTILFSNNFDNMNSNNIGILASLIRTGFGLNFQNIIISNNINLFDPISLRCSKSSLFFNTIYSYNSNNSNEINYLNDFGFEFNLNKFDLSEIDEKMEEIKELMLSGSSKQIRFIYFNFDERSNDGGVNENVFDPLVAGSIILSRLRQLSII